jgi:hypothetical protein
LVVSFQQRLARQFQVQVADWLDTCRDLSSWEDEALVGSSSAARLAQHALMLDEMEHAGEWLSAASIQLGLALASLREQIQLTLQDLRDSRAMWHHAVPAERKAEILRECFHES